MKLWFIKLAISYYFYEKQSNYVRIVYLIQKCFLMMMKMINNNDACFVRMFVEMISTII